MSISQHFLHRYVHAAQANKLVPAIGLFLLLLATTVFAGDFENGLKFSIGKDYGSAANSFRKAADNGKADAQFNLALMYEEGRGVTQSYAQAASWYQKAAEQGHAVSQFKLGAMLFKGQGVKADIIEAYKWFSLANDSKKRRAKMDMDMITSHMTQPQITEALLRKNKWLKTHRATNLVSKSVKQSKGYES